MTDATPEEINLSIDVRNFPPGGPNAELRPLMFGGPGNPMMLVEIVGESDVVITLANISENDELPETIDHMRELLELVLGTDVGEKAAAELARMKGDGDVSGE